MTNGHLTTAEFATTRTTESYTFSNGVTAQVLRVAPLLANNLSIAIQKERAGEKPKPPINMVDYGSGPVPEPNPLDEAYIRALREWEAECWNQAAFRFVDVAIAMGVSIEIDHAALQAMKDAMASVGAPITESDKVAYVKYCCMVDSQDFHLFREFVQGRARPNREAVQAHKDTFPADVAGEDLAERA